MNLKNQIKTKNITFGVIGLGYVGLPLAVEFANAGFKVVGIDVDEVTVNKINYAGPGPGEYCVPIDPHHHS